MSATDQETAGFGVGLVIDDIISNATLMDILKRKIDRPEDFLPVTDVFSRPSDDGLGIVPRQYLDWTEAFVTFP